MKKQKLNLNQCKWELQQAGGDTWLSIPFMPMQVHEILYHHKLIPEDFEIGIAEKFLWVAEADWNYRCRFPFERPEGLKRAELICQELDTIASLYLNGRKIADHESLYCALSVDVTDLLKEDNLLEIQFESPYRYMKEHPLPPQWQGKVLPFTALRKSRCDFTDYLGARPYLTPIGVAGGIHLSLSGDNEILQAETSASLNADFTCGTLHIDTRARAEADTVLHAALFRCGEKVAEADLPRTAEDRFAGDIAVDSPALWWPRGFGEPALYEIRLCLRSGETVWDELEREVGFRTVTMDINFNFTVNGRKIRLWGSNFPPIDGKTHRYNPERAHRILDLVEAGNMNTLRTWGENEPLDDDFYRECDRRGILVWQEFFNGNGMQPDDRRFVELCVKEAEYNVLRLRHHPCIFMWCGGNEGYMGGEFEYRGAPSIGGEIYVKEYAEVCRRLDPGRYYHPNSPYGGPFTNYPLEGDMHGYEMWWHTPQKDYPYAITEQMRVSIPGLKSLKRFIPADELWPDDFTDINTFSKKHKGLIPKAWEYRAGGMLLLKSGNIEQFYDADTPDALIYKFGAAHALALRKGIERSRMGRPSGSSMPRRSNCHLVWKFFDTWPLLYSSIIDVYLEPYIPYYNVKRAYAPVSLCFDIRDSIYLWLVNDSAEDVEGTLEYGIFNPGQNRFLYFYTTEISMKSGCSGEAVNLDFIGDFRKENILFARFTDKRTGKAVENVDYVEIERKLLFPDAKLTLRVEGNELLVETDRFARCVELSGNDNGDEFGWYFEDNYFDLLPGTVKRIAIRGSHCQGIISAKGHYSTAAAQIEWHP